MKISEIKATRKQRDTRWYAATVWEAEVVFEDGARVRCFYNAKMALPQDGSGFKRPVCVTPDGQEHCRGFLYSKPISDAAAAYMDAAQAPALEAVRAARAAEEVSHVAA